MIDVWCSDDVDDQYTEKGRILIRKEGDAMANGMRIGEILAADDLELQLPGMQQKKREEEEEALAMHILLKQQNLIVNIVRGCYHSCIDGWFLGQQHLGLLVRI